MGVRERNSGVRCRRQTGGDRGFITDVTDRKEAERRLLESEERYRLLAEYTTDLVCIHEPDRRFNYVSPSSEDVLGFRPEELVGRDPYELAHPEDKRRIRETSHGHLINGAPYAHVKHRMRRKDGKYIWLDTYSVSVFGEDGELKQIVCSTRDITEQKVYEQELVDAREEALEMSRLKSSFLALDDNEQMLRLIERFLKDYDVETFSTEQGLLDSARDSGSEVVLLDINLGDNRNGIDVLNELRKLQPYQRTPVLAVTAYALPEDKDRFLEEGFNDYLAKPFDRNVLVQTIERHIAA